MIRNILVAQALKNEEGFDSQRVFSFVEKASNRSKIDSLWFRNSYFSPDSLRLKAAILDFELDTFAGFLFNENVFQAFAKDRTLQTNLSFFNLVLSILNRLLGDGFFVFSFSLYEHNILHKGLKLFDNSLARFPFLAQLGKRLINLQDNAYESMSEALMKIGISSCADPLFRNKSIIEELYHRRSFKLILSHNRSCLLNEYLLLTKRFLVKNALNP